MAFFTVDYVSGILSALEVCGNGMIIYDYLAVLETMNVIDVFLDLISINNDFRMKFQYILGYYSVYTDNLIRYQTLLQSRLNT
jgi:hypothetical protein